MFDKTDENFSNCFEVKKRAQMLFKKVVRQHFSNFVCNVEKDVYEALVSPKILAIVKSEKVRLDKCFKNSWNKSGGSHYCG